MIRSSIRRPVAVAMVYLALALLGVVSWYHVPVELLPDAELPRLKVTASWRGASPEATEALVTSALEGAVQQVRGIERVSSVSEQRDGMGTASVDAEFARGVDMDFARLDLAERLAALEGQLPRGATSPRVEPFVPEEFAKQSRPFLRYTVTGPYTPEALRRVVDQQLAPPLRQLDGVAEVRAQGGRERLVEVELDPARILALGLTPEVVRARISTLEQARDVGRVRAGGVDYAVALRGRAESTDSLRRLPLLTDRGRVVRLADVGIVRDGWDDAWNFYRIDGHPAVSFEVVKEVGTNVVAVADRAKAHLAANGSSLPRGARLILDDDESEAVRSQLTDLRGRALSSALVVFLVLLLFLRSPRSAAVVFASIAFAVLITLNLIFAGGFSLNVLTLMGLVMGFGLVIDNAVVVLENIFRRHRAGDLAEVAAERGAREMFLPVLAATATTIIVFVPFVYLQGEVRLFYVPLAVVVGFTNIASLFVSFTFTPALAARLLRSAGRVGAVARIRPERPPMYGRIYAAIVGATLRRPWRTVLAATVALAGAGYLFQSQVTRGTVWRPWYQEDSYVRIAVELPRGEELARTDELVRFFEERLRGLPEVARFTTRVYPQAAQVTVSFHDSLQNTAVPVAIKEQLESYGHLFGGAEVRVYGYGPSFYGGGASPPSFSIQVLGYNYDRVREVAEGLADRLRGFPRIHEVDTNASGNWFTRDRATEVVLRMDRERMAMHRISARDVADRVTAAVGREGAPALLTMGGQEVDFTVRLAGHERMDVLELENLVVPGPRGGAVRLGDVARLEEREVMSRILRKDQQYQRTVTYEFRGPAKLGNRVHGSVMAATRLPPGYSLVGKEDWTWDEEEKVQIYGVLALSLVLVFMVTAALFESLRQPLCVLLTVPMALVGVFLIFVVTGAAFTREALIGVIMMGGVVVNNAILLIDHINGLRRREAVPLHDAVLRGTLERVRPILMTSTITIVGLLPLVVFSEAADANIWNAMGYALLGGLGSSTVLVLTVTPALYLLFERGAERRRHMPG